MKIAGSGSTHPENLKSGEKRVYRSISRKDSLKDTGSQVGKALNRVVTQAKYEEKNFIELDARSRKIGFEVLKRAMSRPYSTEMRD